jgi:RNA polymerase sigma-70 factor (ECF subfamily)
MQPFAPGRHLRDTVHAALAVPLPAGDAFPVSDDLVARSLDGDRAAFEALYRAHVGRVYALCMRLTADRMRAEELTQDTFVQAWRGLTTFRGESAFASWLHRIAVNAALGEHRSTKRRELRVMPLAEPPPGRSEGADVALTLDLERAISALPPGARAVFVLHDIEGYAHEEIAGMMGVAAGTSKAQLHRARRLLREGLSR